MEQKTIGKFISALRKANGYTQQQVADILCVSNKTVSKWERDDGYPEITMLPAIAELYGVTVDEILKGERIENSPSENVTRKTEERTKLILEKTSLKFKNYSAISVPLGAGAVILSFITDNNYSFLTWIGRFFLLLLITVSVIIGVIACNNYTSALNSADIDGKTLKQSKKNIYLLYSFELFFLLTTFAINIMNIFIAEMSSIWWKLILSFVSFIIALIVHYRLSKKTSTEPCPEVKALRKKTTKITVVLISTILVISYTIPFIVYRNSIHFAFTMLFDAYLLQALIPCALILPIIYLIYCAKKRKLEK